MTEQISCPVDNYVFPGLDRLREGDSLEARFNAFKIPESNFLVFEATVRSCRDGCQPAYCSGSAGRSEPSFGKRRRRSLNGTTDDVLLDEHEKLFTAKNDTELIEDDEQDDPEEPEEEHVREMIEVSASSYDYSTLFLLFNTLILFVRLLLLLLYKNITYLINILLANRARCLTA